MPKPRPHGWVEWAASRATPDRYTRCLTRIPGTKANPTSKLALLALYSLNSTYRLEAVQAANDPGQMLAAGN